ncbi:hypothetical protein Tco_0805130 [Tanacetum coccineum]
MLLHLSMFYPTDHRLKMNIHAVGERDMLITAEFLAKFQYDPLPSSQHFSDGIYWDDVIHWIDGEYDRFMQYKLDFVNKTIVLRKIQFPLTVVNYCKLFESCGCLLLLAKDKTHSDQLNVYEMKNGHSEWSLKYSVNHSRISSYGPSCCIQGVVCIVLGEREEDSFMVIYLDGEAFLYKFVLKNICRLPELESMFYNRHDLYSTHEFLFTASFASV